MRVSILRLLNLLDDFSMSPRLSKKLSALPLRSLRLCGVLV